MLPELLLQDINQRLDSDIGIKLKRVNMWIIQARQINTTLNYKTSHSFNYYLFGPWGGKKNTHLDISSLIKQDDVQTASEKIL